MSDTIHPDLQALDRLTEAQHENARRKGFVEMHDRLLALVPILVNGGTVDPDPDLAEYLLTVEAGNELMLIVTELGEAHEEIRTSPFAMHETYYVDENGEKTREPKNADGTQRKPEGLGSELADVQIRLGDTVHRRRIGLGTQVGIKAEYNSTRTQKHGGKAF